MHLAKNLAFATSFISSAVAVNITHNGLGSTPAQRYVISASQALTVISAARNAANKLSYAETIAVMNPSGWLVALVSMDNAPLSTIDIAIKKAKTTALTNGAPSDTFLQFARGPGWGIEETNGGLVVFAGGLPVYLDGILIGAVGCSGAPSAALDVEICSAGAQALK